MAGLIVSNVRVAYERTEKAKALEIALEHKETADDNLQVAMANLRDAERAVDRFGMRTAELLAQTSGTELVRRELLEEILQYHERFLARDRVNQFAPSKLALTHCKIAQVNHLLGDHQVALRHYRQAEQKLREIIQAYDYLKRAGFC